MEFRDRNFPHVMCAYIKRYRDINAQYSAGIAYKYMQMHVRQLISKWTI